MADQGRHWCELAAQLGFDITAPITVSIGGEEIVFTAHLPQFGSDKGMIIDPDGGLLSRHATALLELGFGFSAVELEGGGDAEGAEEMLRDWGWVASEPKPSWW
jgi:hypothetical protein